MKILCIYERAKMTSARLVRVALSAGLSLCGAGAVQAQTTDVVFCNTTREQVQVAVTSYKAGISKWMLQAWYQTAPGKCVVATKVATGNNIYYYAEKRAAKTYWPAEGKVTYCVPLTMIERVTSKTPCAAGERRLGFQMVQVSGPKYTITMRD
jgi:uncharacterized membrane protein